MISFVAHTFRSIAPPSRLNPVLLTTVTFALTYVAQQKYPKIEKASHYGNCFFACVAAAQLMLGKKLTPRNGLEVCLLGAMAAWSVKRLLQTPRTNPKTTPNTEPKKLETTPNTEPKKPETTLQNHTKQQTEELKQHHRRHSAGGKLESTHTDNEEVSDTESESEVEESDNESSDEKPVAMSWQVDSSGQEVVICNGSPNVEGLPNLLCDINEGKQLQKLTLTGKYTDKDFWDIVNKFIGLTTLKIDLTTGSVMIKECHLRCLVNLETLIMTSDSTEQIDDLVEALNDLKKFKNLEIIYRQTVGMHRTNMWRNLSPKLKGLTLSIMPSLDFLQEMARTMSPEAVLAVGPSLNIKREIEVTRLNHFITDETTVGSLKLQGKVTFLYGSTSSWPKQLTHLVLDLKESLDLSSWHSLASTPVTHLQLQGDWLPPKGEDLLAIKSLTHWTIDLKDINERKTREIRYLFTKMTAIEQLRLVVVKSENNNSTTIDTELPARVVPLKELPTLSAVDIAYPGQSLSDQDVAAIKKAVQDALFSDKVTVSVTPDN